MSIFFFIGLFIWTGHSSWIHIQCICKRYKKSLKIPKGYPESVNPRRTDNTPFDHSFITTPHVVTLGFSIYFFCLLKLCRRHYFVLWLLHVILKYSFYWLRFTDSTTRLKVKLYFQSSNPLLMPATIQMYYSCFLIILLSRERILAFIRSTHKI